MNPHFPADAAPIKLYRNPKSGHCHRVELMMALLKLPYEPVDLDMANGAHKAPDYLKLNPFGKVPVIDDNGTILWDSNAILVYLVKRYGADTGWLPEDPVKASEVQCWLSIAAGEIAFGPASARLAQAFGAQLDHAAAAARAHALFKVMEPILESRSYLAGELFTIADVAGYAYIAHAPEGGVSLEFYPAIRAWLRRIEGQPNFVPLISSPTPEAV